MAEGVEGRSVPSRAVSGRYAWLGSPAGAGTGAVPRPERAELRLDVDGPYALDTASGEIVWGCDQRVHWVAALTAEGADAWRGELWYRSGSTEMLPATEVRVERLPDGEGTLSVRFGGGGFAASGTYARTSTFLREVEFEFDATPDADPVTHIVTHDHPVRPADLAPGRLSVADVFGRAGFEVRTSAGDGVVPLEAAAGGASGAWSDAEMHDAMEAYWTRFDDRPQWAMWVLFAHVHEDGPSLGGLMFDRGGARPRQGTAIFTGSFIGAAPEGEAHGDAWVRRMRFWTACHEMGHAFNLAHSWEKDLCEGWVPLACDPEARSFMNYPHLVRGGEASFFGDFDFRFSPPELLFLRHAPEPFVAMGGAPWARDCGLRRELPEPGAPLTLAVRANRPRPDFAFMEPVVLEVALRNASGAPLAVPRGILASGAVSLVIRREDGPARRLQPPVRRCGDAAPHLLAPGAELVDTVFAAVDRDGWAIAEPGRYAVQASLRVGGGRVVSDVFRLRVLPPRAYCEAVFAQDLFEEDVGRVMAVDGTRRLDAANATLAKAADAFRDHPLAGHARIALASPLIREFKEIVRGGAATGDGGSLASAGFAVASRRADATAARADLHESLIARPWEAATSLSHIDFRYYVDRLTASLEEDGRLAEAVRAQRVLLDTLDTLGAPPDVIVAVRRTHDRLTRRKRRRDGRDGGDGR